MCGWNKARYCRMALGFIIRQSSQSAWLLILSTLSTLLSTDGDNHGAVQIGAHHLLSQLIIKYHLEYCYFTLLFSSHIHLSGSLVPYFATYNAHPCFWPKLSGKKSFVLIQFFYLYVKPLTFQGILLHIDIIIAFYSYTFFKRFYLFIFRQGKGKREGEKHPCVVASHAPPTGDLDYNPGMCPDWEWNRRPFGLQLMLNPLSYTSQGQSYTFNA